MNDRTLENLFFKKFWQNKIWGSSLKISLFHSRFLGPKNSRTPVTFQKFRKRPQKGHISPRKHFLLKLGMLATISIFLNFDICTGSCPTGQSMQGVQVTSVIPGDRCSALLRYQGCGSENFFTESGSYSGYVKDKI